MSSSKQNKKQGSKATKAMRKERRRLLETEIREKSLLNLAGSKEDAELYRCAKCEKIYLTKRGIENHLEVHFGEKPKKKKKDRFGGSTTADRNQELEQQRRNNSVSKFGNFHPNGGYPVQGGAPGSGKK